MAIEIDTREYKLSCELRGHQADVRGISVCGNFGIATSSWERTVRFWSADGLRFSSSKIMFGHTRDIEPAVWVLPCDELLEGGVVSGGMDTVIV